LGFNAGRNIKRVAIPRQNYFKEAGVGEMEGEELGARLVDIR